MMTVKRFSLWKRFRWTEATFPYLDDRSSLSMNVISTTLQTKTLMSHIIKTSCTPDASLTPEKNSSSKLVFSQEVWHIQLPAIISLQSRRWWRSAVFRGLGLMMMEDVTHVWSTIFESVWSSWSFLTRYKRVFIQMQADVPGNHLHH